MYPQSPTVPPDKVLAALIVPLKQESGAVLYRRHITSLTTDAAGNELASMRYKAWGETRHSTGSLNMDDQYTGLRTMTKIGLHFYREASRWDNARWYDSSLSRFAQADTIVPPTQGVQGWDRFAYTNNNPLRYTDPSGHGVDCGLGESCVIDPYTSPLSGSTSSGSGGNSSSGSSGGGADVTILLKDEVVSDKGPGLNMQFPPCLEDIACEPFSDKIWTEDEIDRILIALQGYYDYTVGAAILSGVIAGVAPLAGQAGVSVVALLATAEFLWEAHNASTLIAYLSEAKNIAHEQGGVRITMSHRSDVYGGIPVVIEYKGAGSTFILSSPGLLYAFGANQ